MGSEENISIETTLIIDDCGSISQLIKDLEDSGFTVTIYPLVNSSRFIIRLRKKTDDEIAEDALLGEK